MTHRKTKKSKLGPNAYQAYMAQKDHEEDSNSSLTVDDLRANPDLAPHIEPNISDELAASIEVIQEGGLTKLIPTQQKIFQLSIVEGEKNSDIAETLGIDEDAVEYHLQQIGLTLRKLVLPKLRGL